MEILPLLGPFPYVLWLTGSVLFALSLLPRLDWLRTSALVAGVIGSILGYVALRQHWTDAQFGVTQLFDYRTAHNFFVVVWPVAAFVHIVRFRFFPERSIPGWTQGLFLIGMVLGSAYLIRSARSEVRVLRAAIPSVTESPSQAR